MKDSERLKLEEKFRNVIREEIFNAMDKYLDEISTEYLAYWKEEEITQ